MINIGTLLSRHARYRPDHLALVVEDERLNYRRFNAQVNRLANWTGTAHNMTVWARRRAD